MGDLIRLEVPEESLLFFPEVHEGVGAYVSIEDEDNQIRQMLLEKVNGNYHLRRGWMDYTIMRNLEESMVVIFWMDFKGNYYVSSHPSDD